MPVLAAVDKFLILCPFDHFSVDFRHQQPQEGQIAGTLIDRMFLRINRFRNYIMPVDAADVAGHLKTENLAFLNQHEVPVVVVRAGKDLRNVLS